MPKNISTLLSNFLKKIDIDVTDPKYTDLLNVAGTIGDEAFTEVEKGMNSLLTVEQGKYNSDLRKHFRQNVLDPVDKELNKWMDEQGYSDEDKAEVVGDPSTYARIRKALEKTVALEAKKTGTGGDKKLSDALAKAQRELADLKDASDKKVKEAQDAADNVVTDFALKSRLSSLPFAHEDKDEASVMFRPLLDAKLKTIGAKYAFDKTKNELSLLDIETGEPYHDKTTHKPVVFSDFVSQLAADKKVLKNTDSPAADQGGIKFPTQIPAADTKLPRSNQNALDLISSRLK